MASRRSGRTCGLRTACTSPTTTSAGFTRPLSHRLCDRWSSGGLAEETAEWMAVTRARSASQPGAGADSSTPNPGKLFGTRSPLYRCWPHRLSTSGGNDAGVLRKLGPQKPKAPPVATLFLRWSSAAPAVSHSRRVNSPGDRIVNTDVDPAGNASNIYTTEKFGDSEVYVEFMVAAHSNSGFFMHGLYETQIWDSWGTTPRLATDQCGAMYHYNGGPIDGIDGGITPKVRADRPPGQWQSFHYWFQAPRFDASGKKIANAKFLRILHNGQLIHENVERRGPTVATLKIPEAPTDRKSVG